MSTRRDCTARTSSAERGACVAPLRLLTAGFVGLTAVLVLFVVAPGGAFATVTPGVPFAGGTATPSVRSGLSAGDEEQIISATLALISADGALDGAEVGSAADVRPAAYEGDIFFTSHVSGATYTYARGNRIDVDTHSTDNDNWGLYRVLIGVWDTQMQQYTFLYRDDENVSYWRDNWFWCDTVDLAESSGRYRVVAALYDDHYGVIEDIEQFNVTITPPSPMRPVYRFYRSATGTHFYTADAAEMARVRESMQSVYKLDGIGYYINSSNPSNSVPLYRFYNRRTGTHLYTADENEKNSILANLSDTYALDGVAYYVTWSSGLQVHRFYSPSRGVHFYSADPAEIYHVRTNLSAVWRYEGPAYRVGQ